MTAPTPDASTPEGRFLTAYGSWQHARVTAGLAVLAAPPAQVLTLAANLVHWTIELDQSWERLEGESYAQARNAHPARGVLSALKAVRERTGVLFAVEITTNGPKWRPAQDLALGPVDHEIYTEHLSDRGLFDIEATVLDLWVNGDAVAGGRGRQVLEQAAPPAWEAGDEAPHDPPPRDSSDKEQKALADIRDELAMFSTHTPEEIEAYHAARGGYFLTLVVGEEGETPSRQADGPLGAWHALMRQVRSRDTYPAITMGGSRPLYLFKGKYAQNTVRELAQVARALNPGHWEVVEGYRPVPKKEETDPHQP